MTHGTEPVKREARLAEEIIEMSERGEEEVRGHHHSDLHVNADHLAGPSQVVDEDDQLHPTFPLVRLIPMEHGRLRKKYSREVSEVQTDQSQQMSCRARGAKGHKSCEARVVWDWMYES